MSNQHVGGFSSNFSLSLFYVGQGMTVATIHINRVNLEVDVLAKYVERSMGATLEALRGEIKMLQDKVARLEAGGASSSSR